MKTSKAKASKSLSKLKLELKPDKGEKSMSEETSYTEEENTKSLEEEREEASRASEEKAREKADFEADVNEFKEDHKDQIEKFGGEVVSPFGSVTATTDKTTATAHETYQFYFRKKGRLSPVGGTPPALLPSADTLLWRPQAGRRFVLQKVFVRSLKATGTGPYGTSAPTVGIKTGTVTGTAAAPIFTPGAIVATATAVTFASDVTVIPVASEIPFDNTKPLFLSYVVAGGIASITAHDVEVIVVATKISD